MALNTGGNMQADEPEVVVDINTTPLIDVMLVLLIMLIITIPIQTHAVKLDMPVGNPPPPPVPPKVVTIEIDFDGGVYWDNELMPSREALDARMQGAAAEPVQPEIHLWPNKLVKYRYVAQVMADAQRLGMDKIGIVGKEQFLDQ